MVRNHLQSNRRMNLVPKEWCTSDTIWHHKRTDLWCNVCPVQNSWFVPHCSTRWKDLWHSRKTSHPCIVWTLVWILTSTSLPSTSSGGNRKPEKHHKNWSKLFDKLILPKQRATLLSLSWKQVPWGEPGGMFPDGWKQSVIQSYLLCSQNQITVSPVHWSFSLCQVQKLYFASRVCIGGNRWRIGSQTQHQLSWIFQFCRGSHQNSSARSDPGQTNRESLVGKLMHPRTKLCGILGSTENLHKIWKWQYPYPWF